LKGPDWNGRQRRLASGQAGGAKPRHAANVPEVPEEKTMNTNRKVCTGMLFSIIAALALPLTASAQEHGGGGGGGGEGGCGDVFGDLVHVLRDNVTGQPILAQRWIELPAELQGYGWGYCPIAVYHDEDGVLQEIDFIPYTCDLDPDFVELVEEVDYFGRLNGGRTKERNHRMHFNEVISNIKQADVVRMEETGRLELGFDCKDFGKAPCAEWATIDSPMESMALYVRIMKYGHIATDPYEIDTWAHGDPKLATQFHPALSEEDWQKFQDSVANLLPNGGKKPGDCWDYDAAEWFDDADADGVWDTAEPFFDIDGDGEFDDGSDGRPEPFTDLNDNGLWDPAEDFVDANGNGVADEFVFLCSAPEELVEEDFFSGAINLAAAANKTGKITTDLVQYMNRILKITKKTPATEATLNTLPALYRDCWPSDVDPVDPPEEGPFVDPLYDSACTIVPADPILTPEYALFPDIQERFMDYSALEKYKRDFFENVSVILNSSETSWLLTDKVSLNGWVGLVNGGGYAEADINGFVAAGNDVLRAIEYVHNYDPPVNLYCVYQTAECNAE
jgi:hypothetical protein